MRMMNIIFLVSIFCTQTIIVACYKRITDMNWSGLKLAAQPRTPTIPHVGQHTDFGLFGDFAKSKSGSQEEYVDWHVKKYAHLIDQDMPQFQQEEYAVLFGYIKYYFDYDVNGIMMSPLQVFHAIKQVQETLKKAGFDVSEKKVINDLENMAKRFKKKCMLTRR